MTFNSEIFLEKPKIWFNSNFTMLKITKTKDFTYSLCVCNFYVEWYRSNANSGLYGLDEAEFDEIDTDNDHHNVNNDDDAW